MSQYDGLIGYFHRIVNMAVGYQVKVIRCESGERLPLLVNRETGIPLWDPTLFLLTELRSTSRASSTLSQAARAVMVAHQAFDYLEIDIVERLAQGRLIDLGEIDSLTKLAGLSQLALDQALKVGQRASTAPSGVISLEKARMRSRAKKQSQVQSETKDIRLMYIRDYIAWLAAGRLLKLDAHHPQRQSLSTTAELVVGRLNARISGGKKDGLNARQGVSSDVRARALEVVDPLHPENPWKNKHVRSRNQLIFMWLLLLGLRNGEFLTVRARDVNLRAGEVTIYRRPDDPEDPRAEEAKVKKGGRLLALSPELAELTRLYLTGPRSKIPGAKRHPFLIVATGTGKPLSRSQLNKLFRELRTKVPGLPDDLSPHVLRHTWNDDFSELMDERGVEPADEERMRKQAMGWSDSSKMPAHYTKRSVQRKTNEASLAMQAKSFKPKDTEL